MGTEFVYLYNLFLIVLYSATVSISLVNYFREGQKQAKHLFLVLALLFTVFILDNSVIAMTELISRFAQNYNHTFQGTSFIKSSVFLITNFCQLWLISFISQTKTKKWELFLISGIFLYMILPFHQGSAWQTYLYYLPNQLFLLYLGIRAWLAVRAADLAPLRIKYLKIIGCLSIVFGLCILLEDSYIIFNIDQYSQGRAFIINRNFSENLFSIGLALLSIYYCLKDSSLLKAPADAEETSKLSLESFFQDYRLTEREKEVCQLLLEQKHNQEIASELFLSIGTVKTHIHNIYIKTDVRKREELFSLYDHYSSTHP